VYVTSPQLLGKPIVSTVFFQRSREEIGTTLRGDAAFFSDKNKLTIEHRIKPVTRAEMGFRVAFERNHVFSPQSGPPDPSNPIPFDETARTVRLGSTLSIDRRNDLLDTTRGWFQSSSFDYSPHRLGSDIRFVKYFVQQRYYYRAGRIVLASYARLGLANAFDQTLPPDDRFFAGGSTSVRGYVQDALSPVEFFRTVGGEALLVLNQEVRFPIVKIVRGVVFVDAGRAFAEVHDIRLGDLGVGSGLGLRLQTPVVLLRVDYGLPFDKTFGPRHGRWYFGIGQMF
jgi:outer membrane protein assembly factor BamA